MTTFASLIVLASIVAIVIQVFRRKFKSAGLYALVGFVAFVIVGLTAPPTTSEKSVASAATSTDAPAATDAPADESTPQIESKADLLANVNRSITPEKLAGNPQKYQNDVVQFDCKVANVLAGSSDGMYEANAQCGSGNTTDMTADDYHLPATIVLIGANVNQMDAGQNVKVLGVATTEDGTNLMGGATTFPAVKVDYAE
jgi:hypothetical protein